MTHKGHRKHSHRLISVQGKELFQLRVRYRPICVNFPFGIRTYCQNSTHATQTSTCTHARTKAHTNNERTNARTHARTNARTHTESYITTLGPKKRSLKRGFQGKLKRTDGGRMTKTGSWFQITGYTGYQAVREKACMNWFTETMTSASKSGYCSFISLTADLEARLN